MKNTLIICIVIAFIGAITKLFLQATKRKEHWEHMINAIVGFTILIVFMGDIIAYDYPKINFSELKDEDNYSSICDNTITNIYRFTEDEIEKILCEEIYKKFGIESPCCNIIIDFKNMAIKSAEIYIYKNESFISEYKVITFIKSKYDIDAEVFIY